MNAKTYVWCELSARQQEEFCRLYNESRDPIGIPKAGLCPPKGSNSRDRLWFLWKQRAVIKGGKLAIELTDEMHKAAPAVQAIEAVVFVPEVEVMLSPDLARGFEELADDAANPRL